MVSRCTARCEISPKRRYESTEARSDSWTGFSFDIWYRRIAFRVNVKSRLIKLVLLPLWYGNKDIIRDNLSGRHIVENFDIVSIQHYPKEEEIHIHLDEKKSIPVEFSSRRVVFNRFTSAVSRNGRLCGTADGNSRVSVGYYEFYYICLRWYFETNEHIANAAKHL